MANMHTTLKSQTTTRKRNKRLHFAHPGEILWKDFLKPMGISQYRLCKATGIPPSRLSRLINGKVALTADTAYRLALFFDVSPIDWLNLQNGFELRKFERNAALRRRVKPLSPAAAPPPKAA
jgi:addiction module HigA family antidote